MSKYLKTTIERVNGEEDFDFFILNMANNLKLFTYDMWLVEGRLLKCLSRILLLIIFVSCCGFFFETFHSIWHGSGALTALFVGCELELVVFKLGTTLFHRTKLFALFDQIRSNFWQFNGHDLMKREIVMGGSRKMRIVVQLYSGIMFASFLICISRPIFNAIIFKEFESPLMVSVPGEQNRIKKDFRSN